MKKYLLTVLLLSRLIFPQSKNPDEIISAVIKNYNNVNDYQVDINTKVDVEFIKVPETKARLYFKQPDKMHLESDGFAMLPRNGLEFTPALLLKKNYTSIYEQDVDLNGIKTSIVKVIPLGDQGDVILTTLWVDQKKQIIRKIESTTKVNGTFTIDFTYDESFKFPLPEKLIFSFNIDKMKMPQLHNNQDLSKSDSKPKGDSTAKGRVIISYKNYLVNKGIPDSVFDELDKKEKK